MTTTAQLVEAFFGRDPLRGEDAYIELLREQGAGAIETLIPLQGIPDSRSTQISARLKSVAERLGPAIVPYLASVIAEGSWPAKLAAASCFAAFNDEPEIEAPLLKVLERGDDFDAERTAIEALTYLGADGWAWDLVQYAKHGEWRPGTDMDWDDVSEYPFEKLSCVCPPGPRPLRGERQEPGARRFPLPAAHRLHRSAAAAPAQPFALELYPRQLAHGLLHRMGARSRHRVMGQKREREAETSMPRDPGAGCSSSRRPIPTRDCVRPGGFPRHPDERLDRTGWLRHPLAARLLAEALQKPSTDRAYLDWAFSTLYAVPVEWSGLEEYVDSLLEGRTQQSARLAYSLALKGDRRVEARLIERLDDEEPFQRWTAALALARLLGPESRPYLEHRAEEAGDDLERCGMLAAAVRAGDGGAAERLHRALQALDSLPALPAVWQLELLDALRGQGGFDERAFRLWRAAAGVNPRKLQYFEALVPAATGPVPQASLRPAPPPAAPRKKLFISYSRHDGSWLQRFQIMLRPLLDNSRLELWDDTRIVPGKWRGQIEHAMGESQIALFLVSAHFLASEFITRYELPELLKYAEEDAGCRSCGSCSTIVSGKYPRLPTIKARMPISR